MKSIYIRQVPEDTLEALKRLARHHHRSLQSELHTILESAAERAPHPESGGLHLKTVRVVSHSTWSREEMYGDSGR